MHQKLARIQISHQELLRRVLIFSQIFFISTFTIRFFILNFHLFLNWQILDLSLRMVTQILRKITYQSAYFQTSQTSLNDAFFFFQISNLMDSYLTKQQCGFRKGCSTTYCLLVMLEKRKKGRDKE